MYVEFLADFDDNGIASHEAPIEFTYHAADKVLDMRVGGYVGAKWVTVAEGLLAGITLDGCLGELHLIDFHPEVTGR
jgi:hypothetical protein